MISIYDSDAKLKFDYRKIAKSQKNCLQNAVPSGDE